jgi:nucleotide-binding universal stress UspA family protein
VTRHGHAEVGRWLVGSVTAEVLRRTTTPVVLVPRAAPPMTSAGERLVILASLDGSDFDEAALAATGQLAAQLHARLVLFRAVSPVEAGEPGPEAQLWQAREYLTNVARRLTPVVQRLVVRTATGLPAVAIPQAALETGADLIAVSTRGPADPEGVSLGGVATAVLRRTSIPLILVRPQPIRSPSEIVQEPGCDASDPPNGVKPGVKDLMPVKPHAFVASGAKTERRL